MQTKEKNISKKFNDLKPLYKRLGMNIQQALETFLKENDIAYLSINHRIKDLSSFLEKIERKKYDKPFEEIEDICGIRIICYYQSDIEKIQQLIKKEFEIVENQDKIQLLGANEFGYRSMHFIAKIKSDWSSAPNYRGLADLKAEIQIRTILMHSWAEIEHKLSYKSETHIPKDLRRKFSRISAKLEETDEQFEEIKNSIEANKLKLLEEVNRTNSFDTETDLNLDNLQAFMDFAFPDRDKQISETSELLDEMIIFNISFKDLIKAFSKYKDNLIVIEKEENDFMELKVNSRFKWSQTGAIRALFLLISDNYFESKSTPVDKIIEKWRMK